MARSTFILGVIFMMFSTILCADICPRGYFLYKPVNGSDTCLPCSGGSYMDEDKHTQRICHECSRVQEPFVEYVHSECNATHNTVILCEEGYYRTPALAPGENGKCNKCTECDHPVYTCQGYQDTVCCPNENYGVGIDADGKPVCVKQCGQGEYVVPDADDCLPCPAGTFMNAVSHTSTQCSACPKPASSIEKVLRECTRKEPTLLGCVQGYYRKVSEDSVAGQDSCVRCTDCQHEGGVNPHTGRQCDSFHDTVCCPMPDMIVLDTPEGPCCKVPNKENSSSELDMTFPESCGMDQYLYTDGNNNRICLPCPAGTYMDVISHTNNNCKKCADFSNSQDYSTCQTKPPSTPWPTPNVGSVGIILAICVTTFILVLCVCVLLALMVFRRKRHEANRKLTKQPDYLEKMIGHTYPQLTPQYFDNSMKIANDNTINTYNGEQKNAESLNANSVTEYV